MANPRFAMKNTLPRRPLLLAALGAGLSPTWAQNAPSGAVALPDIQGLPPLAFKWAGRTRLSVWGFKVYDAQLWVGAGFRKQMPTAGAFVVDLTYLRDLNGADIARRSVTEMQRQGDIEPAQEAAWLAFMQKTFPNVKANDRLLGIHQGAGATRFVLNGKDIGRINDANFAQRFFGIWLSPQSSEPEMRDALLSGAP